MRCIQCNSDNNYQDRQIRHKCKECGHSFAFEPQSGDPITDKLFYNALLKTSSNFEIYWLKQNLYYELCRRSGKGRWKILLFPIILFFILCFLSLISETLPLVILWLGLCYLLGYMMYSHEGVGNPHLSIDQATFEKLWKKWCKVNGTPKNLIATGYLNNMEIKPEAYDLEDYSFDRAIICEHSAFVDLLVANNFHFENNCAILSIDGYPKPIFEKVRSMLRSNPELHVSVIHDASVIGMSLADFLRNDPEWFSKDADIKDLGLHVSHARRMKGLYKRATHAHMIQGLIKSLPKKEIEWLMKYEVSLYSLLPIALMKGVFSSFDPAVDSFG